MIVRESLSDAEILRDAVEPAFDTWENSYLVQRPR